MRYRIILGMLGLAMMASTVLQGYSPRVSATQVITAVPQPTPTTEPAGGMIPNAVRVVSKTIEPTRLLPGGEATVTISLHGEAFEECFGVPGAPLDVVLIVDNSLSARAYQRLDKARSVTQAFIDQLSAPVYLQWDKPPLYARVGIVTSNYTEQGPQTELAVLDQDYSAARSKLANMDASADTGLDAGMRLAAEELSSKTRQQAKQMVLLVMHDNVPVTHEAIDEAQKLRQAGVNIYVIGVGRKGDLNETEVAKLTGDATHFVFEPQPRDLFRLFVLATGGATDLAAKDYRISDDFSPVGLVELVPDSVSARGADVKTSVENGRPVWRVPLIRRGDTVVLSYRVRVPLAGVGGPVQLASSAGWLCCNGCFHSWATVPDAVKTIEVMLPTATSGATNAPMRPSTEVTIFPTQPVTTAAVGSSTPVTTPTATGIPIISSVGKKLLPFIPLPWRDILIILLVPIVLFLLWLLWRWLRSLRRSKPVSEQIPEVNEVHPPRSAITTRTPMREPTSQPESTGSTGPGTEGDDQTLQLVLEQELRRANRLRGHVSTTELDLREPWPIQVLTLSQPTDMTALALKNKGEIFCWQKEDGTSMEVPVITLEKVLAKVTRPQCPVIVVSHAQPTDNLTATVDTWPNNLKKQLEVAVRAVYHEPEEGQPPQPLKFYLHIQAIPDVIGSIVQAPVLEQNL